MEKDGFAGKANTPTSFLYLSESVGMYYGYAGEIFLLRIVSAICVLSG